MSTSIATIRRRLTLALVQRLDRCPCCNQPSTQQLLILRRSKIRPMSTKPAAGQCLAACGGSHHLYRGSDHLGLAVSYFISSNGAEDALRHRSGASAKLQAPKLVPSKVAVSISCTELCEAKRNIGSQRRIKHNRRRAVLDVLWQFSHFAHVSLRLMIGPPSRSAPAASM